MPNLTGRILDPEEEYFSLHSLARGSTPSAKAIREYLEILAEDRETTLLDEEVETDSCPPFSTGFSLKGESSNEYITLDDNDYND